MWAERKHTSRDAAHATRVVGAILRKVSMQEPASNRSPPPPPPKPELRDGSLAILLNNDMQQVPMTPSSLDPMAIDFSSLDFINNLPLDAMLSGQNTVDWVSPTIYILKFWFTT